MFFALFLASLWHIWCHWQLTSLSNFNWPFMQEERKSRRDLGVLMVGHLLIPNTRVQYVWVTLTTSPWQTRVFTNSASPACWSGVRYFFLLNIRTWFAMITIRIDQRIFKTTIIMQLLCIHSVKLFMRIKFYILSTSKILHA